LFLAELTDKGVTSLEKRIGRKPFPMGRSAAIVYFKKLKPFL